MAFGMVKALLFLRPIAALWAQQIKMKNEK
jgi:hypothetical protein